MRKLLPLGAVLALIWAAPASADVGLARTAGDAGRYDRNASVVQAGAQTYLFFARSQGACNRLAGCDADNQQYDLYLKRSADGGKTYGPAQLVAANPDGPGPHRGRTIAATLGPDGRVDVFWADGGSSIPPLYALRETAPGSGTFSAPAIVGGTLAGIFNVEAVTKGGQILLYTEELGNLSYGVYARTYDPASNSASPPTPVEAGRSLPKAIVDRTGVVRIAYVDTSGYPTVNVEVESSADGLTWPQPGQVVVTQPGASNWDPNLIQKPNGEYYLHYAPDREGGTGRQQIAVTTSLDFVHWTTPRDITPAFKGGVEYWDYWPEAFIRDSQVVLYYTSERAVQQDGTSRPAGIGHLWSTPGFSGLDGNGSAA